MAETSTRLRLRVSPGAGKSGIIGRHGDAWKVRVTAPPEDGRANEAVVRLVADVVAGPRQAGTGVSGHGARDKTLEVGGGGPGLSGGRDGGASSGAAGRKARAFRW